MREVIRRLSLVGLLLSIGVFFASNSEAQKPSTGSKPKYAAPEKPKPKPPPAQSKPKYTPPPKSEPPKQDSKPKYTPPPKSEPPKQGATSDSKKPTGGGLSDKARANAEARSQRKFEETKQAVVAPKPTYKTDEGKVVHVQTTSKAVEQIRTQPSSNFKPEVREKVITTHIHNHYQHPPTWYYSQPSIYVGGGYSSAFWWMMMEWDAERRARWLYHHRYEIEHDAYERGIRDAQVSQHIAKLEAQRFYRDPNYIDTEFASDPSVMYDDNYIEAAYNPKPVPPGDPTAVLIVLGVLGSIVLFGLIVWGLYHLVFCVRWGT